MHVILIIIIIIVISSRRRRLARSFGVFWWLGYFFDFVGVVVCWVGVFFLYFVLLG